MTDKSKQLYVQPTHLFAPTDDITASELAGVLEMAGLRFRGDDYDAVMARCPNLARHFRTIIGTTQ